MTGHTYGRPSFYTICFLANLQTLLELWEMVSHRRLCCSTQERKTHDGNTLPRNCFSDLHGSSIYRRWCVRVRIRVKRNNRDDYGCLFQGGIE